MKKIFVMYAVLVFIILTLISCTEDVNPFFIETTDGERLSANYFSARSDRGIIMLHGYNQSKTFWHHELFHERKYNVMAIDFRWAYDEVDYKSVLDVRAAEKYMREQGVRDVYILAYGIGGNVAVKYAAQTNSINKILIINPRDVDDLESYQGVVGQINGNLPVENVPEQDLIDWFGK